MGAFAVMSGCVGSFDQIIVRFVKRIALIQLLLLVKAHTHVFRLVLVHNEVHFD